MTIENKMLRAISLARALGLGEALKVSAAECWVVSIGPLTVLSGTCQGALDDLLQILTDLARYRHGQLQRALLGLAS